MILSAVFAAVALIISLSFSMPFIKLSQGEKWKEII
jgi:hypothetical protein